MEKIDAHMHVNFNDMNADDIIQYLDKNNISASWILTWEERTPQKARTYTPLLIDAVLEAHYKYPDRLIPFYAPPPTTDSITLNNVFKKYISLGIKGCGELKASHLWREDIIDLYLKTLQNYDLPLIFHMEGPRFFLPAKKEIGNPIELFYYKIIKNIFNQLPIRLLNKYTDKLSRNLEKSFFKGYLYDFLALEKMLNKYPEQIFIAHGPHFWNNISKNVSPKNNYNTGKIKNFGIIDSLLEEYDNLYCDISGRSGFNGLTRDPEASKMFIDKHFKKILFGTDNYINFNHEQMINSFRLPKEKTQRIFYKNALNIIPL